MESARELFPPVMSLSLGVGLGSLGASLAAVWMPTYWKKHSSVQTGGRLLCFKSSFFFFQSPLPPLFVLSFLHLKGEFPYSVATVAGSEWAWLGWEHRVEVV